MTNNRCPIINTKNSNEKNWYKNCLNENSWLLFFTNNNVTPIIQLNNIIQGNWEYPKTTWEKISKLTTNKGNITSLIVRKNESEK